MIRGSCLCGGIRFEAAEIPLIVYCHCSKCRKANGSAFEAGAAVRSQDLRFNAGMDLIQSFESSPGVRRGFCRVCGSRAPSPSRDGASYFVPAGLLDDDPGETPALHIFVGSKAPWWTIDDDLPKFDTWVPGYGPEDSAQGARAPGPEPGERPGEPSGDRIR
jgi:hypothetical protein